MKDIRLLARMITREGVGVLITDHNVREALGLIKTAPTSWRPAAFSFTARRRSSWPTRPCARLSGCKFSV